MQKIIKGSTIKIEVGDAYLVQLQNLINYYTTLVPEKEMKEQIDRIEKGEELNQWGQGFHTLLLLLNEIEQTFITEGLVEEKE